MGCNLFNKAVIRIVVLGFVANGEDAHSNQLAVVRSTAPGKTPARGAGEIPRLPSCSSAGLDLLDYSRQCGGHPRYSPVGNNTQRSAVKSNAYFLPVLDLASEISR